MEFKSDIYTDEEMKDAVARLLQYSMKEIDWKWDRLTPLEKSLIPREQLYVLEEWAKARLSKADVAQR
jgi:hypothetical protein